MFSIDKNKRRSLTQYFKRPLAVIYVTIVCMNSVIRTAIAQTYPTFIIPVSDSILQNQFLDANNDVLYMGALNSVYKLNSDLALLRSVATGPVNDSVECRPPPHDCDSETVTDNYNKVILLHEDRLVTCGSIYQGTCELRDPDSLSLTYGSSIRTVVPNTPDGLAVAFIADGNSGQVMYVASSCGDWLTSNKVTVSTRQISQSVQDNNLFKTTSDGSQIVIPQGTIDRSPLDRQFNISYIYGFTSGQFSYFVAFQPSDHLFISRYTSKVVRLCHDDREFSSYIELPLSCANNGEEYNLVQSALIASLSLGGEEPEEVLVATFSKSDMETSGRPTTDSAICIYPIQDINQAFWNRRLACVRGETGNTEINWAGSTACSDNDLLVLHFVNSNIPIINLFFESDMCDEVLLYGVHPTEGTVRNPFWYTFTQM